MQQQPFFKSGLVFPAIVAIAAFLLYANTIPNNYALDDGAVIIQNPSVQQGIKGIPGIFTTDVWHFEGNELGYYRPLSLVSFAIENQFFGNNPHVSHLVNALLYAITGFILCLVLLGIFSNYTTLFSLVIALLFIAHPIHTEVVANIKSRDEILSFLNLLLAIYFLIRSAHGNWKWIIAACFFYYLALLSRESAIAGLLLLPVILYFTSAPSIQQILKRTVPFVGVLLLFLWQKQLALGTLSSSSVDIVSFPYAASGSKLATAFSHLYWYIKLVFVPYPLSYNYAYNEIPVAGWSSATTIPGILFAVVLMLFSFYQGNKKTPQQFGVFVFVVMLIPGIGFVLLKGGILSERFLYAPTLGFCIAITWLVFKWMKIPFENEIDISAIRPLKFLPFVFIFLCYSFITVSRNMDWKDDLSISGHDVKVVPNSCQVHLHYGKKLIDLGVAETDKTKRQEYFNAGTSELQKAIIINPHYARAYFKLAYAYHALEVNNDSSIYYYNCAIDEAPGYGLAYNNLGALYSKLGRTQLAIHYLQKALEINPDMTDAARNLQQLKQVQNALPENTDSASFEYCTSTGIKYAREKNFTDAVKYLQKAVDMKPSSVDALVNMAACYGMMQDYKKSEEVLLKAEKLEPNNKSVVQNLFTLYHLTGNKVKEKEYGNKLKKLPRS